MANRSDMSMPKDDESRWLEIEQNEFVLDQVPNVTAEFTTHNSPCETVEEVQENFEQNFNRLHRIADKIKHTIREHLNSESSTCSDVTDLDTPIQDPLVNHYADQSLDEFKEELRLKREARQNAVQEMRDEIASLREKLEIERNITKRLRNNKELGDVTDGNNQFNRAENQLRKDEKSALDGDGNNDGNARVVATRNRQAIIELANAQLSLQMANSENISLRTELAAVQKQCTTLKEVVACCKQMMAIKEEQCSERSPLEITQSEDLRHKMANALERLRVSELKQKLNEIEKSFEEHETKIMSDNLRQEYEKQLDNIRQLRQLYEERQRIVAAEYENLQRLISIKRDELAAEQGKTQKLTENNQQLKYDLDLANNELECLRDECKEHRYEKTSLKDELGAVNTLFSQMVLGFNGKNNLDIDRLMLMLEENRALLNEMASKELNCSDGATLPKLLFELVQQAIVSDNGNDGDNVTALFTKCENDENDNRNESNEYVEKDGEVTELPNNTNHNDNSTLGDHLLISNEWEGAGAAATTESNNNDDYNVVIVSSSNRHTKKLSRQHSTNNNKKPSSVAAFLNLHESDVVGKHTTAQEIIGNLPKVWRVLMELLSHHNIEHVQFDKNGNGEDCYTSTDMSGAQRSQPELSVSKTYLKLKDLILEKKSLVKETKRLKTLNSHLEYRLNEQEKRLSAVSLELTKTWHLVGKMQRQHRQLHTQEQILRYQLQQKRRLLTELKEELEYCRRKWAAAKAKNDETQIQCDYLRREFAKRKLYDSNNSGESGYSDSGGPSAEEDEEAFDVAAKYNAITLSSKSFEHSRKIKRMQSTSPGRAELCTVRAHLGLLRCNSAPPTYNWCNSVADTFSDMASGYASNVPSKNLAKDLENISQEEMRAPRIRRLEEQCKDLILQVLETSHNRENLELQLKRLQEELTPIQSNNAKLLCDILTKARLDRTLRASSVPNNSCLTSREEEYTRKRSERLHRLEEESRQLISHIKRTSDRGHYLCCSVDRLRRQPNSDNNESYTKEETDNEDVSQEITSQNLNKTVNDVQVENELMRNGEASLFSRLEEPLNKSIDEYETKADNVSRLSKVEEAYTARRAARLQRLEKESKKLLSKLSSNAVRGNGLGERLDNLHERFTDNVLPPSTPPTLSQSTSDNFLTIDQRISEIEEKSLKREARLRRLEEEGKQLISDLSETSKRGTQMINRIAERDAKTAQTQNKENAGTSNEAIQNSMIENIMPLAKNVALSSIVSEDLTQQVTVTSTPSQINTNKGAIPKTKPTAQLCAAQPKSARLQRAPRNAVETDETLEDMIKRLKAIPFPQQNQTAEDNEFIKTEKTNEESDKDKIV